jgi:hypothetical protein
MLKGFLSGQEGMFYAAGEGGGGTGATGAGTAGSGDDKGTGTGTGGAGGTDQKKEGEGGEQKKEEEDRRYTQAELDQMVADRLKEEKRKTEGKTAAEKKKQEEDQLRQNAEWEKLAEQRGVEIEQLKGVVERADKYAELLNRQIDHEIKGWPKEVVALDPGKDQLEVRLSWVEKSRALAEKMAKLPTASSTEAGHGNRPTGTTSGTNNGSNGDKPRQPYRFQQSGDVKW